MALISSNLARKSNPVFYDEATRKKIDRHISDINDVITDKDIENVKTDVTPNSTTYTSTDTQNILRSAEEREKGKEDGNNSNSIETSWNVLK